MRESPPRLSWIDSILNAWRSRTASRLTPSVAQISVNSSRPPAWPASWRRCCRFPGGGRNSGSSTREPGAEFSPPRLLPRCVPGRRLHGPTRLHATVWEIDERLVTDIARTLRTLPRSLRRSRRPIHGRPAAGELHPRSGTLACPRRALYPTGSDQLSRGDSEPSVPQARERERRTCCDERRWHRNEQFLLCLRVARLETLGGRWGTRRDYAPQLHERVVFSSVPSGARQRAGLSARTHVRRARCRICRRFSAAGERHLPWCSRGWTREDHDHYVVRPGRCGSCGTDYRPRPS